MASKQSFTTSELKGSALEVDSGKDPTRWKQSPGTGHPEHEVEFDEFGILDDNTADSPWTFLNASEARAVALSCRSSFDLIMCCFPIEPFV